MTNRFICDILHEMRKCNETRNFAPLLGLIEECQIVADRMEAALYDKKDERTLEMRLPKLKDQIEELEWKKDELEEEVRRLEFRVRKATRQSLETKDDLT